MRMFCPDCGCILSDGARICPDCGHRIKGKYRSALGEDQPVGAGSRTGMSSGAKALVYGETAAVLMAVAVSCSFFLAWGSDGTTGMEVVKNGVYTGRAAAFLNFAPLLTVVSALLTIVAVLSGRTQYLMATGAAAFMFALLFGISAGHGIGMYVSAVAGLVTFFVGLRSQTGVR